MDEADERGPFKAALQEKSRWKEMGEISERVLEAYRFAQCFRSGG